MAIRFGSPPDEVFASLGREITRLETLGARDNIRDIFPSPRTTAGGVESFVLRRASIERGEGLESAEPAGWRIRTAPGTVAELRAVGGSEYRVAHVESAHLAASFDAVMEETPRIAGLQEGDYELRALFAPEFALMCAWLHGGRDAIVPLPGSFYLQVWTAYTPDEFVAGLREIAANRARYPI